MISVNELRVGNIISDISDINYKVYRIGDVIHVNKENGHLKYSQTKPIPLTKEWLINFGFEKINENEYEIKRALCGHSFKLSEYGFSDNNLDGFYFDCGHPYDSLIKSVHQLQNIYFALTGKELIFKK